MRQQVYIGTIQEEIRNNGKGEYLVKIPELISLKTGVWVRNALGNKFSRFSSLDNPDKILSQGTYKPMSPGQQVKIVFENNDYSQGKIIDIFDLGHLPCVDENRDGFTLISKTIGGAWIYQDDTTLCTHIINNNGSTNIVLHKDKISMTVGKHHPLINAVQSGIELDETSLRIKIGNGQFAIDESGFNISIGNSTFSITESGVYINGNNVEVNSDDNIKIVGDKVSCTGSNNVDIYSQSTKITGATHLNLTGKDIGLDSVIGTTLKGTYVNVDALVGASLKAPQVDINSMMNIYIDAPVVSIDSQMLTLKGTSTAISSSAIFMDGIVQHSLGIGTSIASGMTVMNKSLRYGLLGAGIAVSNAMGTNNPISNIVNSTMVDTMLSGTAKRTTLPEFKNIPSFKLGVDVAPKISLIKEIEKTESIRVIQDTYSSKYKRG
jgi:hypothetical protein